MTTVVECRKHASAGSMLTVCKLICRFAKPFKLRCCAAFGGLQKYAQVKALQTGQEVAVATPGRLIDLVASKACNLERVTIVVIDEVDRCFDLGFEPQVCCVTFCQSRWFTPLCSQCVHPDICPATTLQLLQEHNLSCSCTF